MTEENNISEVSEAPEEPKSPAGQTVVGIRFRSCGKIYTFDVNNVDAVQGSRVVIDSELGLNIGHVVTSRQIIEKTRTPLKKILRLADAKDFETIKTNRAFENEARQFCSEKVKEFNLPMKIVVAETTLDKKRLTFYFTADGRIDFRELVRDLASRFKTRIEMRQIGVRDEVKLLGAFGCCGRQTCCSLFLTSFEPVTIKMAKDQSLSINQSKLSGVCGRLMCCLGYEKKCGSHEEERPRARRSSARAAAETASTEEFQPVDPSLILENTEGPQVPSQHDTSLKEKPKPGISQPEKRRDEDKRRFRRDRGRRNRPGAEKAAPASAPVRQVEAAPAAKAGEADSKGKGRPFNKRRKFWKKKKE